MNKKQLIARVQRYMGPGATRESASAALKAVLEAIESATKPEESSPLAPSHPLPKAHIPQLGTFQYAARRSGLRLTFRPAASLRREYGKEA